MEKVVYDYQKYVGNTQPDDVYAALTAISQHPDVISTHEQWEYHDEKWKESQKRSDSQYEIMKNAALTRESMAVKNTVHDAAATIACEIAEKSGILIDYDGDTLGDATPIDDVPELSAAWHNLRRGGIGGSTVSKILGFHWKTRNGYPIMMDEFEYAEMLTDMAVEKMTKVHHASAPTSGVLYRGHQWEPVSLAWLSLTHGINIGISKKTWRGSHPLQVINVDGIILDDDGNPEGIVECKTSSRTWTWQWGVPTHYRAQVLWYLNATGLKRAELVVRFDNGTFDVFTIHADETVDGTDQTEKITSEAYMSKIEDAWNEIQEYMDDHELLWDMSQRLSSEKHAVAKYFDTDDQGAFANDDFLDLVEDEDAISVVQVSLESPYERMDESFTLPVSVTVNGSSHALSGAVYPLYPTHISEDVTMTLHDVLSDYEDTTIIAQDSVTYSYLTEQAGMKDVIHISALARIIDDAPGAQDFDSCDGVVSWINTLFQ